MVPNRKLNNPPKIQGDKVTPVFNKECVRELDQMLTNYDNNIRKYKGVIPISTEELKSIWGTK